MGPIEGTVTALRETWPLQLVMRVADGTELLLSLQADTRVLQRGAPADLAQLRPGMRLSVQGNTLPGGLSASQIDLLD